jgi:hypothetical protein
MALKLSLSEAVYGLNLQLRLFHFPIQKSTLYNYHTRLSFPWFLHYHIQTFDDTVDLSITIDIHANYGRGRSNHALFA